MVGLFYSIIIMMIVVVVVIQTSTGSPQHFSPVRTSLHSVLFHTVIYPPYRVWDDSAAVCCSYKPHV